jgi:hypothetical protein
MPRNDISDYLIHFTKGTSQNEAFENLCSIATERCLRGNVNHIKGEYRCICFSEAPLTALSNGLVNPNYYSKYSPFGVMVPKRWLYAQGGRPIIYQSDNEFYELPEAIRWRHVRYEPASSNPIDFTWEREWRVQCPYLHIAPEIARLIVPDSQGYAELVRKHHWAQDSEVYRYSEILGDEQHAESLREPFRWVVLTLG